MATQFLRLNITGPDHRASILVDSYQLDYSSEKNTCVLSASTPNNEYNFEVPYEDADEYTIEVYQVDSLEPPLKILMSSVYEPSSVE